MVEVLSKLLLSAVIVIPALGALRWIWTNQIDLKATVEKFVGGAIQPDWIPTRDANKLYQAGRRVADVSGEVEQREGRVLFHRLVDVRGLNTADPVEYGRLKLRVRQIGTIAGTLSAGTETLQNVWDNVDCEVVTDAVVSERITDGRIR